MGYIYANAEIVVVWLGEEDWNSKVAMISRKVLAEVGNPQEARGPRSKVSL